MTFFEEQSSSAKKSFFGSTGSSIQTLSNEASLQEKKVSAKKCFFSAGYFFSGGNFSSLVFQQKCANLVSRKKARKQNKQFPQNGFSCDRMDGPSLQRLN